MICVSEGDVDKMFLFMHLSYLLVLSVSSDIHNSIVSCH